MSGRRNRAFRAYQKVKSLRPARSVFDLSHEIMMSCDMFKLYPCCFMEMSPGDTFHIWNQHVTRLQPLNAPILSPITMSTHYFFVPYRILFEQWVEFITGGTDGEYGGSKQGDEPSETSVVLPRWEPTNNAEGSLWDYFGFPTGVDPKGAYPLDFPRRAYNMIWNEYYRDENHQEEVGLDNEEILYRAWRKDYFTSALDNQQRGVSPSMPISGSGEVRDDSITIEFSTSSLPVQRTPDAVSITSSPFPSDRADAIVITGSLVASYSTNTNATGVETYRLTRRVVNDVGSGNSTLTLYYERTGADTGATYVTWSLPIVTSSRAYVDFESSGVGFDVKDLRQAFQIQKWLELANRGGIRYTEFLRAFFGVSPRDDRLQRPEYIGGTKSPIVISEVLQTSETTENGTPLAQMGGHGISCERTYVGSYSAQEYGILMGVMSFTTPPVYSQGINRQWLRRSKYDFLFPQFTHMSEQAIEGAEIYATDDETENRKVWGFNEIYDELRSIPSLIVGKMRSTFNYWHLGRLFGSKPSLNEDFISGKDVSKRIFAVQDEEGILVDYANLVRAVRPLPKYGTPGGV